MWTAVPKYLTVKERSSNRERRMARQPYWAATVGVKVVQTHTDRERKAKETSMHTISLSFTSAGRASDKGVG